MCFWPRILIYYSFISIFSNFFLSLPAFILKFLYMPLEFSVDCPNKFCALKTSRFDFNDCQIYIFVRICEFLIKHAYVSRHAYVPA